MDFYIPQPVESQVRWGDFSDYGPVSWRRGLLRRKGMRMGVTYTYRLNETGEKGGPWVAVKDKCGRVWLISPDDLRREE